MIYFDVLFGMDCLCICYATVDCHAMIVKFKITIERTFVLKGGQVPEAGKIISFMKLKGYYKKVVWIFQIWQGIQQREYLSWRRYQW